MPHRWVYTWWRCTRQGEFTIGIESLGPDLNAPRRPPSAGRRWCKRGQTMIKFKKNPFLSDIVSSPGNSIYFFCSSLFEYMICAFCKIYRRHFGSGFFPRRDGHLYPDRCWISIANCMQKINDTRPTRIDQISFFELKLHTNFSYDWLTLCNPSILLKGGVAGGDKRLSSKSMFATTIKKISLTYFQ